MTTATRKRKGAVQKKAAEYIGDTTFEANGQVSEWTNDQHVAQLVNELPWMRMATVVLNKTDVEMETVLRGADSGARQAFMDLVDVLIEIGNRHAAAIEIGMAARTRLLVVFDRCINGPNPAEWAAA